jgi:ubiquinone biosynthesis protein UbiJ
VVQGAKNVGSLLTSQFNKHQNHLAQVLTEEWRVAPAPLEIAYFCDQVDDVKSQAARLEAKLAALLEKISKENAEVAK